MNEREIFTTALQKQDGAIDQRFWRKRAAATRGCAVRSTRCYASTGNWEVSWKPRPPS